MAIVINGSGTVTGLSVGGLPDGTVDADTLASGAGGVDGVSSSADATAIKIDSSERVAIGNTDAGNYYSSADNLVVYDATDHVGITIASGGSDKINSIYFADGTSGTAEYEGSIEYQHSTNTMLIGTNHATVLSIDSTGAVTMPKQPAFLAKLAGNMNNIANSTWTTIEASTEIFDQNSDYNTSTYTFTAPVTGKYQFNAMVRMENVDNNTDFQYVVFSTDNRVYYGLQSWRQTADVPQTHHQLAILADMDANDTCRVRVYIANGHQASDIADTSIWSGHLVC